MQQELSQLVIVLDDIKGSLNMQTGLYLSIQKDVKVLKGILALLPLPLGPLKA